jgi:alkylation response protein AidB-like acyl-CoA dehydrogenase
MAIGAARRAVDASIRVLGASALAAGHVIERLARDVRALSVLGANEDAQRAVAAESLLPQ